VIADILSDPQTGLQLKYEAVGVLTQATDPWIDLQSTLTYLGRHLEKIVFSLTSRLTIFFFNEKRIKMNNMGWRADAKKEALRDGNEVHVFI